MRVLALITDRVNPATSGTRVRNHFLWPEIKKLGVEVRLLGIDLDPSAPFSPGPPQVESEFVQHEREEPLFRILKSLFYSYHQWPFSPKLAARVDRVVKEWSPDIIHAEELRMAPYLPNLRRENSSTKQTVCIHNVESDLQLKTGSSPYPIIKPLVDRIHHWNLLALEAQAAEKCDMLFAYSPEDMRIYEKKYRRGNWSFTSGGAHVRREKIAPQINDPKILIVGTWSYQPNIEGIHWFMDKVLPLLPKAIKITVAGSRASSELKALFAAKGFAFVDTPIDLEPLYKDCAISAIPLLSGSGTRGRILESLSYARAVVTTTKGAEGLQLSKGEGLLLADTPDLFARKINLLLENFNERRFIAETGYNKILRTYDWRVVAKDLVEQWQKLVQGYYLSNNR